MTLIITALCRDGICICADKRTVTRHPDGSEVYRDDLYKIYKFAEIPLIIFNHGINKINRKPWDTICSNYEQSDRWRDKSFRGIVEDFKDFIQQDILIELRDNTVYHAVGFVLCGKTSTDRDFGVYELFWNLQFLGQPRVGIVLSGDGEKYLDTHISNNPQIFTIPYWEGKSVRQATDELKRLFCIAVQEKKRLNGEEFSDDFDTDSIIE